MLGYIKPTIGDVDHFALPVNAIKSKSTCYDVAIIVNDIYRAFMGLVGLKLVGVIGWYSLCIIPEVAEIGVFIQYGVGAQWIAIPKTDLNIVARRYEDAAYIQQVIIGCLAELYGGRIAGIVRVFGSYDHLPVYAAGHHILACVRDGRQPVIAPYLPKGSKEQEQANAGGS